MKTLDQYLRENFTLGNIDHVLRCNVEADGRLTFYIRPQDANGDTLDFEVTDNALYPNEDAIRDEE